MIFNLLDQEVFCTGTTVAFNLNHDIVFLKLNAATQNLAGKQQPFFERCVYYDELSEESVQELHALSSGLGMQTLIKINEKAAQLKAADKLSSGGEKRINIGLYTYHETADNSKKDLSE